MPPRSEFLLSSSSNIVHAAATVEARFDLELVDTLFERLSINPGYSKRTELRIPSLKVNEFLYAVRVETGDPRIGVSIGEKYPPSALGPGGILGRYVLSARSLEQAIARLHRGIGYHEQGASIDLVNVDTATRVIAYRPGLISNGVGIQGEAALVMLADIITSYTGSDREILRVYTATPARSNRALEEVFGCQVVGASNYFGIEIAVDALAASRTVPVEEQLDRLSDLRRLVARGRARNVSERVLMLVSDLADNERPTLESVSGLIGVGPRKLQRMLNRENTCFREITQEALHASANRLLEQTTLSVNEIAVSLGYSSKEHFIRAYRTYAGTTPGAARRAMAAS